MKDFVGKASSESQHSCGYCKRKGILVFKWQNTGVPGTAHQLVVSGRWIFDVENKVVRLKSLEVSPFSKAPSPACFLTPVPPPPQ